MFLAKKYCPIPYIFVSCYLKNTSLYEGKVKVIGAKNDISPEIVIKKRNPVIEFQ